MGRAISSLTSADDHRAFSCALAGFAQQARQIVEQQHRGVLVYAGGDDVLAFLPLPEALACAEDLRNCFATAMASACADIIPCPTLSVGLGIGHLLESLGELLALGRSAERLAKDIRNALAVIVEKRSGNTYAWRAGWDDGPASLLNTATQLLAQRLSSRKVYEIANLLERLPKPVQGTPDSWSGVLAAELRWALARTEEGGLAPEDVGLQLDHATDYPTLHACVRDWVERLLVARTFARALPQKQGRSKANEVSA
jgi:CRISPR-associated protein Cmr2